MQRDGVTRATVCVALVVLLAGCAGVDFLDDGSEVEHEQPAETPTPTDDADAGDEQADAEADGGDAEADDADADDGDTPSEPDGPEPYHDAMESLDESAAEEFDAAVRDEDGEFVDEAEELFELLAVAEASDHLTGDVVTRRVADEGEVRGQTMTELHRTLNSPAELQVAVMETAFRNSNDDALLDGEARLFRVDPNAESPEVAAIAAPLAEDGYDERDLEYMTRVGELSADKDNAYKGWSQAEELGLLHDAVADGEVDEDTIWELEDDSGNELINGMEEEFGTDPQQVDTSGDGFDDNYKWGPLRDLGLDVNPDEVDVYIEMDFASGADEPSPRQLDSIRSAMNTESGDDVPRVNLHFEQCDVNVQPVTNPDDMDETMHENHQAHGYGFHYYLMNSADITRDDGVAAGVQRSRTNGNSWIVANIDSDDPVSFQSMLIAHELGHAFGLFPRDFDGIDSEKYSGTEYNSVMNYNLNHEVTFSTGSPFNDYEEMLANDFGQVYQSQDDLETAWENGEIPEDQPCRGF